MCCVTGPYLDRLHTKFDVIDFCAAGSVEIDETSSK